MLRRARPQVLLTALVAATGIGCGQVEIPVNFSLVGNDSISLEVPAFPPPDNVFGATLVGGAQARVIVDLNPWDLFTPQGLAAAIVVDRVAIAGTSIDIFGLQTGTLCIYDDPATPGGGFVFMRPLRHEADFTLTLNTLIQPTDPFILTLFPDPLPFSAAIDETLPLTLSDLLGLLAGGGAGIELSQELQSTLPPELPILGGSLVTADLTLATTETFPVDPLIDECEAFLAGP